MLKLALVMSLFVVACGSVSEEPDMSPVIPPADTMQQGTGGQQATADGGIGGQTGSGGVISAIDAGNGTGGQQGGSGGAIQGTGGQGSGGAILSVDGGSAGETMPPTDTMSKDLTCGGGIPTCAPGVVTTIEICRTTDGLYARGCQQHTAEIRCADCTDSRHKEVNGCILSDQTISNTQVYCLPRMNGALICDACPDFVPHDVLNGIRY